MPFCFVIYSEDEEFLMTVSSLLDGDAEIIAVSSVADLRPSFKRDYYNVLLFDDRLPERLYVISLKAAAFFPAVVYTYRISLDEGYVSFEEEILLEPLLFFKDKVLF